VATMNCHVNSSPATLLVNISGRFYEYNLKGEINANEVDDVQDNEMLRKVKGQMRVKVFVVVVVVDVVVVLTCVCVLVLSTVWLCVLV